jgi:membrane-associated protease RseP (regulator of RpoE activity)
MAEALAKPVRAGSDGRPLVVGIMGSGHIRFGHGVEHQLHDLGVERVASLLPASLPAECKDLQAGLADAVFVLPERSQPVPEPPRLGITLEDDNRGLRIAQVKPGSLAEKSGLQAGDRILEMAGRPGTNSNEAVALIRRQPPGTWLPLRVARKDTQLDVVVRFPASP